MYRTSIVFHMGLRADSIMMEDCNLLIQIGLAGCITLTPQCLYFTLPVRIVMQTMMKLWEIHDSVVLCVGPLAGPYIQAEKQPWLLMSYWH